MSKSGTTRTGATGPKVSSRITRICGVQPISTVGG